MSTDDKMDTGELAPAIVTHDEEAPSTVDDTGRNAKGEERYEEDDDGSTNVSEEGEDLLLSNKRRVKDAAPLELSPSLEVTNIFKLTNRRRPLRHAYILFMENSFKIFNSTTNRCPNCDFYQLFIPSTNRCPIGEFYWNINDNFLRNCHSFLGVDSLPLISISAVL